MQLPSLGQVTFWPARGSYVYHVGRTLAFRFLVATLWTAPLHPRAKSLAESMIISLVTAEGHFDLREYQLPIAMNYPKTQWLEAISIYLTHEFLALVM